MYEIATEQSQDILHNVVDPERMLLHFAFFQPQTQAANDFASTFILAYHFIKNFAQFGVVDLAVCEDPLRSLRVAEDGAERQAKLVRNRARKFAQRGNAREMRQLVALTRRLQFCSLPLADVNNRGQYKQSLRCVNRVETDFDRHLAAVFASSKEFPSGAHRPGLCVAEVTLPITCVMRPESLRDKNLDRMANELLAGVTENGLCLRVNQGDAAFRV